MGIGIREARQGLPELVKRVVYGGEEVRIGSRGGDEATLIATEELERLRSTLDAARRQIAAAEAAEARQRPFAGLQALLDSGALRAAPGARARRRIVGLRTESGLSREEQARLGSTDAHEPRYRRPRARA